MKLFPHVLIRVSGGPFEKLEALNIEKAVTVAEQIHRAEQRLAELKDRISDDLYRTIPSITDAKTRSVVLSLRRDIHNQRRISPERLDSVASSLPSAINDDLTSYLQATAEIAQLWEEGGSLFSQEVAAARKALRHLAEDSTLRKGLLLSSQALSDSAGDYLSKDPQGLDSKDFKTERGLIKYISRMYAKTSPFSTFTNLALGKITPRLAQTTGQVISSVLEDGGPAEAVSHIRLNNYLYAYLKGLVTKNPEIYRWFSLRANPTLTKQEDHYVFLTNSNNVESFQRIAVNPVVELIHSLISAKQEGVTFNELAHVLGDYLDATTEDIEAYLNQLIEYGFLEFNLGVSGIDPDWDMKLREKLTPLAEAVPLVKEIVETLAQVRELAGQYGNAGPDDRQQVLEAAYQRFRTTCMKLHEAAGLPEDERKPIEELKEERKRMQQEKKKEGPQAATTATEEQEEKSDDEPAFKHQATTRFYFKPEQIFYEDTTLGSVTELDEEHLTSFIASYHDLLQELKSFEGYLDEQDKMLHFFARKYGTAASVDLFTFYEDYYREFKKPEAERLEKQRKASSEKAVPKNEEGTPENVENAGEPSAQEDQPDLLAVPSIKERHEKNKAWLDQFTSLVKDQATNKGEELSVTLEQVTAINGGRSDGSDGNRHACSYGIFVQLFKEKKVDGHEQLMGVLNASFPGFGKLMSRFLHLFDDAVTADVRSWNQSLSKDHLLLEDCDASYFNANLHPPLMPFEVWMPGGHNSLPTEKQIPITDLQVSVDEKNNRLQLIHSPSQRRVFIFDLGFQGHRGRSQLFQLLKAFTLAEHLSWHPITNAINSIDESEKKSGAGAPDRSLQVRPRIVYHDRIILQRKAWIIPKEMLPARNAHESDWSYFLRLNQWRLDHQMPDEVFVFVIQRTGTGNVKPGAKQRVRVSRDDYKPQYICFKNPFLVTLLEKLIERVPDKLRIEEMLPSSEQLLSIGASKHITEFVVQWYTESAEA